MKLEVVRTSDGIDSLKIVDMYGDFDVDDAKVGDTFFLLYVVYSTGNSFGVEHGKYEYVMLFRKGDVARRNVDRIEEHYSVNAHESVLEPERYVVKLEADDGSEFQIYAPWIGYFESMTYCDVVGLVVEE